LGPLPAQHGTLRHMRTGWQLASALVVGILASGCTVTGIAIPGPAPANRTLVAWSNIVCTQANALDDLRTQGTGGQIDYLWKATTLLDDVIKRFKAIEPAGDAAADAYVADLTKTLENLRPQLPTPDNRPAINIPPAEQREKAKQAADVIARIEPQRPKLPRVAEGARDFINSYNLAPACEPASAPPPERALVTWSDTMCDAVKTVNGLRTDPNNLVDDPGYTRDELASHVNSAPTLLSQLSQPIGALSPTGVKEADDFRTALLAAVNEAAAKLPKSAELAAVSLDDLKTRAGQVATVLDPIKPKAQGFPAVVEKGQALADAYQLAPNCEPPNAPKPPLVPRNGTDYQACQTGTCQVRISGRVDITVHDLKVTVAVRANNLTITDTESRMTLGDTGAGTFRLSGRAIRFHATEMKPTTAVLDISTS
jgi:hypothetical protein